MSVYRLIESYLDKSLGSIVTRDEVVISRWTELDRPEDTVNIDMWDDQAAAGVDLRVYQDALDAGRYDTTVLTLRIVEKEKET